MIWVIAVVIIGEIVIFAQLMLSFQKRGARLKVARSPILKRIEDHKQKLIDLSEKVQSRTAESLAKVDDKITDFTHRTGFAANLVAELDNEAHERSEELGLNDAEEDEEDEEEEEVTTDDGSFNPMKVEKDKGFDPFDTVRDIRGDLEDIFEQIGSLRSDQDIVTSMAQRLASSNGKAKD